MYILLSGNPPYDGRTNTEILNQIKEDPFIITPENVIGLSPDSIDLLKSLLCLSSFSRISAIDAIQHPWITNHRNYSKANMKTVLQNLKKLNYKSKLKEAVYIFLTSQIISCKELNKIKKHFQMLDKDGNGKITRDELMQEYTKVMEFTNASTLVDKIISELDQDGDGNIDYTEFIASCGENMRKISKENLLIAFNIFDLDGNGKITLDEIQAVLGNGQVADEDTWKAILQEADINGDGHIDIKEFSEIMSSMKI